MTMSEDYYVGVNFNLNTSFMKAIERYNVETKAYHVRCPQKRLDVWFEVLHKEVLPVLVYGCET